MYISKAKHGEKELIRRTFGSEEAVDEMHGAVIRGAKELGKALLEDTPIHIVVTTELSMYDASVTLVKDTLIFK